MSRSLKAIVILTVLCVPKGVYMVMFLGSYTTSSATVD